MEDLTIIVKNFQIFYDFFFRLDASFGPQYLARLCTDCFEIFRFDNRSCGVASVYILLDEKLQPVFNYPPLVKFNFFGRMGLVLTMNGKVSMIGWFGSKCIEMVQYIFHLLFKYK